MKLLTKSILVFFLLFYSCSAQSSQSEDSEVSRPAAPQGARMLDKAPPHTKKYVGTPVSEGAAEAAPKILGIIAKEPQENDASGAKKP